MRKDTYITAIVKKLNCSSVKKKEIKKDLESDIAETLEKGGTMEDIVERMGSAAAVAAEFNANFSEKEKKLYKKAKMLRSIGIVALVVIVLAVLCWYALPKSYPLEERGNFREEQLVDAAKNVITCFGEGNDEALMKLCSKQEMADIITGQKGQEIRAMFGDDWGEAVSYGNPYTAELVQFGTSTGVVQMTAAYEDFSVTYTISMNKEMKLTGFYIK